jgi:uncharacterized protein YecE (DUF72 family)
MNEVQEGLKKRYPHIHPLLFQRSVEKAENDVELFDILESFPDYPVVWDEETRRWVKTEDLLQSESIGQEKKK